MISTWLCVYLEAILEKYYCYMHFLWDFYKLTPSVRCVYRPLRPLRSLHQRSPRWILGRAVGPSNGSGQQGVGPYLEYFHFYKLLTFPTQVTETD